MQTGLDGDEVALSLRSQGHCLLGTLRISGCYLVAASIGVIVVGGPCSGVTNAQIPAGDPIRYKAAIVLAVRVIEACGTAFFVQPFAGTGKDGLTGFDGDRSAKTVAAQADRCNSGHHRDLRCVRRSYIGERRIHVVGAGGRNRHAVDNEFGSLIPQPMKKRNAGQLAVFVQADAGRACHQFGRTAAALQVA